GAGCCGLAARHWPLSQGSGADQRRTAWPSPRCRSYSMTPRKIVKPWGFELLWAYTDRYAGKILHIDPGHRLSLQYHNAKDETLYLLQGRMALDLEDEGGA